MSYSIRSQTYTLLIRDGIVFQVPLGAPTRRHYPSILVNNEALHDQIGTYTSNQLYPPHLSAIPKIT